MFFNIFLFDFFSHWIGFTFENHDLLQINFVKIAYSFMSTNHYVSMPLYHTFFFLKTRTLFPNSQGADHYLRSISQPEFCKGRHLGGFMLLLEEKRQKSCCAVILNSWDFSLMRLIDLCRIDCSKKVVSYPSAAATSCCFLFVIHQCELFLPEQ